MSGGADSGFSDSVFSTQEDPHPSGHLQHTGSFERLWRTFMQARVFIAAVLLALQIFMLVGGSGGPPWLALVCVLHLGTTLAVLLWSRPLPQGETYHPQWLLTIGVDVLVFMALQHFQTGSINYTPLLALPVLLASILGPLMLALGTAASVTLLLLLQAGLTTPLDGPLPSAWLLQTALTGTGFFLVAVLANQLALRLAREEAVAQRSQAAARTQAQVNELVIESLSEGVLVVDPQGVVLNANPAAQSMLMDGTYARGQRLQLSARPGWSGLSRLVNETFMRGEPLAAELSISHDKLTQASFMARTRLTTAQGAPGSGLCVLFLEDRREVEARVRTEKLAAMGRLSAAVAHEIRNPLSAITQANALLDEEVQDAAHKRLTRMIGQNAQRLARTVDDILNVARVQPDTPTTTQPTLPLDTAVRQITEEWSAQNRAAGLLSLQLQAPDLLVAFDAEHLRRLLVNLLDNALRHASAQAASISVQSQARGPDRVHLSVWSDGSPLEPSVLRHLFEPFFSSESRSSGLGLYICRELCERYGAQISHQRTRLGSREGNAFDVLMPAAQRNA